MYRQNKTVYGTLVFSDTYRYSYIYEILNVIIFRPHLLGEENHYLCCLFFKFRKISTMEWMETSLDYFSYLTTLVTW